MKNQYNDLFEIISKLTPQEKTFFKAYFLKTKDESFTPSFLVLFDALNELEEYDRQKLKLLLDKKGFRANFFKAQTYLTEAILKALTEYHAETENTIRIGYLLEKTNVLIKKNLISIAKKYFERARKIADANSMYEYQPLLDHIDFTFHEKNSKWVELYMQRVTSHLKTFRIETELRKAGFDSLQLVIEHFDKQVPVKDIQKEVHQTLAQLNMISKTLPLNNFSKSRFYNSKMQCLMILEKKEEMDKTIREYSQYLGALPAASAFFAKTVLHGYNSIIIAQSHLHDYASVEKTFEAAKYYFDSIPQKICTPDISSLYFSYITENVLAIFNDAGRPDKTIRVWEENKKEILLFDKKTSVSLYALNVCLAEFMLGNYHQAVRLANKIPYEKTRPAVFCEARLLLLLSHYELDNSDILSSLARQARKAYEKENMLKPAHKIIFGFFEKKAEKIGSKSEAKKELTELINVIRETEKQSHKETTTGSLNIHLWLQSKTDGKPYAELVKRNAEVY